MSSHFGTLQYLKAVGTSITSPEQHLCRRTHEYLRKQEVQQGYTVGHFVATKVVLSMISWLLVRPRDKMALLSSDLDISIH